MRLYIFVLGILSSLIHFSSLSGKRLPGPALPLGKESEWVQETDTDKLLEEKDVCLVSFLGLKFIASLNYSGPVESVTE